MPPSDEDQVRYRYGREETSMEVASFPSGTMENADSPSVHTRQGDDNQASPSGSSTSGNDITDHDIRDNDVLLGKNCVQ